MTFKTAWFCVSCEGEITDHERSYSHGRCPLCGFKHEKAGSFVETKEKCYKEKKIPSGRFWVADKVERVFIDD